MAKFRAYVTTNYVKGLKNHLKNKYNEIFNVQDLTKAEDARYHLYNLKLATSIYDDDEKVLGKDYDDYKMLDEKVTGEIDNPVYKTYAVELVKKAYKEHYNHETPKWWQFGKRYAYWKEKKVIEEFCDKLVSIGINKELIETAKSAERYDSDSKVFMDNRLNGTRTKYELDDEFTSVENSLDREAFEADPVADNVKTLAA